MLKHSPCRPRIIMRLRIVNDIAVMLSLPSVHVNPEHLFIGFLGINYVKD